MRRAPPACHNIVVMPWKRPVALLVCLALICADIPAVAGPHPGDIRAVPEMPVPVGRILPVGGATDLAAAAIAPPNMPTSVLPPVAVGATLPSSRSAPDPVGTGRLERAPRLGQPAATPRREGKRDADRKGKIRTASPTAATSKRESNDAPPERAGLPQEDVRALQTTSPSSLSWLFDGVYRIRKPYEDGVLARRFAEQLNPHNNLRLRKAAVAQLASLPHVAAISALGAAAESDKSSSVQSSAIAALEGLAEKAAPSLIRTLEHGLIPARRELAAIALGHILRYTDIPQARDALAIASAKAISNRVSLASIHALGDALYPGAMRPLLWLQVTESRPNRLAAINVAILRANERHLAASREIPGVDDLASLAVQEHAGALLASIGVGLLFAGVEFTGGLLTGTPALCADALHLAGDRVADASLLYGMWRARRPPTSDKTFGSLKDAAALSLVGAVVIGVIGLAMLPAVHEGFVHPVAAHGWGVIGFAAFSIVSNSISAIILLRKSGHGGVRGVFMHALADAVGTFFIMLAVALNLLWGWTILMPLATLLVSVMILHVAYSEIGRPAWKLLADAVPNDFDMIGFRADLLKVHGVASLHDIHVRGITFVGIDFTGTLLIKSNADHDIVRANVEKLLREKYGITHSTIELRRKP